jgi:hypothetical protein
MITKDLLQELFEYKDGKIYWKISNTRAVIGKEAGSINSSGYKIVTINQKSYLAHRLIFLMNHGYLPKTIDHIDGNSLNNKIENLRKATVSQNQFNAKIRKDNKTGVKGVTICNKTNKYKASLTTNGCRFNLGLFLSLDEAEKAIKTFRVVEHREFTRHE